MSRASRARFRSAGADPRSRRARVLAKRLALGGAIVGALLVPLVAALRAEEPAPVLVLLSVMAPLTGVGWHFFIPTLASDLIDLEPVRRRAPFE